ncbi:MAG: transglutaminase family protein [Eubacterium sp.]
MREIFSAISSDLSDYLKSTCYVNYENKRVAKQAKELFEQCPDLISGIKHVFEFVRDDVVHSWDIGSRRITVTAPEVLAYREGICYAKSNLLAALLRFGGVPTGFCYQRLVLGDTPDTGHCIHALNAVYLKDRDLWIRLDARGNKAGVDAQFSIEEEKLAFKVRPEYGEIDYKEIYPDPLPQTMRALEKNEDCIDMCEGRLPQQL